MLLIQLNWVNQSGMRPAPTLVGKTMANQGNLSDPCGATLSNDRYAPIIVVSPFKLRDVTTEEA